MISRIKKLMPVLVVLLVWGCGPRQYPVKGTVTFTDGTPVKVGGTVVFETTVNDRPVMARGAIKPDGSFELSTQVPGDGAFPGKYRVKLVPAEPDVDAKGPREPGFDKKYSSFESSGLEIEVEAKPNEIPIVVGSPRR